MIKLTVCIVDSLGLAYDGSTLSKRGLGGSESAIILMAKQLANIGFDVTVFNDCNSDDAVPGKYDGVVYKPLKEIEKYKGFDVFIASRSVVAFAPNEIKDRFRSFTELPNFEHVSFGSKHRVLWMHDTFCDGDDLIEDFILQNRIHEIFTLSDFHTTYITNCNHGKRRNFEILKNKVFQTRNGVVNYIPWVDIKQKDPNLFVFNAAVTKGMVPLLEKVWPKVKQRIPQAKLKVIGGFYKFKSGPDAQEIKFRELEQQSKDNGVEFTGIIKQSEIAEVVSKASFMLYPAAFPETYGISSLESLVYNTPIITCRFGALEEVAVDLACYKVAYAIEPNNLFPWIDSDSQVEKFVNVVEKAYNNTYLHQQKMYACNQVKEIAGWDSVALQWKQHFYRVLGEFLPVDEYRKAQDINNKVRKVFGRKFSNQEDIGYIKNPEQEIVVITPVYNAEKFVARCIQSVTQQDYSNYRMIIVNDSSTDNTLETILTVVSNLPKHIKDKIKIVSNVVNRGAVYNQLTMILENCGEDSIVMLLDGDDWLVNDPNIFNKFNNIYNDGAEFTYGSCWSVVDNIPLIAQPYPPDIKAGKKYREYMFNWKMPYTHLRTFRARLLNGLEDTQFQDGDGNWLRAGGDTSVFYNLIEQANPDNVVCIPDIVYCYNDANPLNDYKVNSKQQTQTSNMVIGNKMVQDEFASKVITRHDTIEGIGPWTWTKLDYGAWDYPLGDWPQIKKAILDNTSKFDVIVQAGGCMGMYPRLMANMFKKVYTFEPDPLNYYCLTKNCNVDNIIHSRAAVGAYEKKVAVNKLSEVNAGMVMVRDGDDADTDVVTIDSLNLEACDVIQLDVERYEMYALIGAIKTIEKFHPLVILEGPETNNDTVTFMLEQMGYTTLGPVGSCNDTVYKYTGRSPPVRTTPRPNITINKKKILLAIPTARSIEANTFKSIYDLEIPDLYEVEYQHFYGYNIDQVRNLIAKWAGDYDYLFSVDSDIVLPKDSLVKMIQHNVDVVSGVYIQRKPGVTIPEIYQLNDKGGYSNVDWNSIKDKPLTEVAACGFGCVLVKSEVIKGIGYPQFVYKSALDHRNTFSEDVYFCMKARENGFRIFVDPSIVCDHIGQTIYRP